MRYLTALLLLPGCTSFHSDMVKVSEPLTVLVTWERVTPTQCPTPGNYGGCTTRGAGYATCYIQMPEDASDAVIAEEFKHCFGWEHR